MTNTKDLFLDKEMRTGGFYELAIQVCPSADNDPIKLYTDYIWNLKKIEGPFDLNYHAIPIDIANIRHDGIVHLGNHAIPFMTYNIREDEPIETGFNWFDICFYSGAIEKVFGAKYQIWKETPKIPNDLDRFFMTTLKKLYAIYPFQLAILGFEVSGLYYLEDLKTALTNVWAPSFFVRQDDYENIAEGYRKLATKMEDMFTE